MSERKSTMNPIWVERFDSLKSVVSMSEKTRYVSQTTMKAKKI